MLPASWVPSALSLSSRVSPECKRLIPRRQHGQRSCPPLRDEWCQYAMMHDPQYQCPQLACTASATSFRQIGHVVPTPGDLGATPSAEESRVVWSLLLSASVLLLPAASPAAAVAARKAFSCGASSRCGAWRPMKQIHALTRAVITPTAPTDHPRTRRRRSHSLRFACRRQFCWLLAGRGGAGRASSVAGRRQHTPLAPGRALHQGATQTHRRLRLPRPRHLLSERTLFAGQGCWT